MEGEPAKPQILENQILQRFVKNPCVVVFLASKQLFHVKTNAIGHNCKVSFFMQLQCLFLFVHPGLGTSTSQEAKEYFTDMPRHRIPFKYGGPEDDEAITLVIFSYNLIYFSEEILTCCGCRAFQLSRVLFLSGL